MDIDDLRKELDGKRMSDLDPWQTLLSGLLWCRDNSAYGVTTKTCDDLLAKALALRPGGWMQAATPPNDDGLKIVWVKGGPGPGIDADGGWMATDSFADGEWINFGNDDVIAWRDSPEPPEFKIENSTG